jgi:hypothetical protein
VFTQLTVTYGSADGGNTKRGYDSITVLRRPAAQCAVSIINFIALFLLLLQRLTLQCNIVYFTFLYAIAPTATLTQQQHPLPPMSSYSVVIMQQCCIGTTVSHCEIYTGLYHYVKQYRTIPHNEIYTGLYHYVKLYWTVPHCEI